MLYVGGSNRTEDLVVGLLEDIRVRRAENGFYEKIHVLTPNVLIDNFLQYEFARRGGIAANIEFTHLHQFLGTLANKHRQLGDVEVLTRPQVQVLVHGILSDPVQLMRPELVAVRRYIEVVDDVVGQQTRCYQLSHQVARFFEEYDYSRQEMLAAWADGRSYFGGGSDDGAEAVLRTESWQRFIWHEIFKDDRVINQPGKRLMPLSKILDVYCASGQAVEGMTHLHVFGFQHMSRTVLRAFQSFANRMDIHLWMLQPGPIEKNGAARWTFRGSAHAAVSQWAQSATDMLDVLSPDQNGAVELLALHERSKSQETTALKALQASIFDGEKPSEQTIKNPIRSVMLFDCPGIQREIETVADDIWERVLASDGTLHFHEIAVVVAGADREEYVAQIRSVFKGFHALKHSFVGLPNADRSPVFDAFEQLLKLPYTTFGRRSFMNLMLHPNVQAGVGESDAQAWTTWCDNLSILFGADQKDQGNTYIKQDFYNWSQGLKRLALGTFLSVEENGNKPVNELRCRFDHVIQDGEQERVQSYKVERVDQGEVGNAAQMSALAQSLISDARWLRDASMSLTAWADVLQAVLDTYVHPASHHRVGDRKFTKECGDISLCKLMVASLVERDLVENKTYSYRTVSLMVLTALEAMNTSREGDLYHGVVVGSAERLSRLPFKHIYMVGMGEGQFPTVVRDNPIDLRQAEQMVGEESSRTRDRQAFMDLVLNARESFSISWVGRDATTGEGLEPSSLVYELGSVLSELGEKIEAKKLPLRRHEVEHTHHPEALIEKNLLRVGNALREHCAKVNRALPDAYTVVEHLRDHTAAASETVAAWMQMPARLGILQNEEETDAPRAVQRLQITLSQLRGFLESPLQGAAKIQLRMREDEDDALLISHEPFVSDVMNKTVFLRRVFHEAMVQGLEKVDFGALHDAMLLPYYELDGTLPTGFFLDKMREEHVEILNVWRGMAVEWIDKELWKRPESVGVFHFGHEAQLGMRSLEPLTFKLQMNGVSTTVELVGSTEMICTEYRSLMTCTTRGSESVKNFSPGFVSYLALSASGYAVQRALVNMIKPDKTFPTIKRKYCREFETLEAQTAYDFLHCLLQSIFSESHAYLLPIELLGDYIKLKDDKKASFNAASWVAGKLEGEYGRPSDVYGPIKNYADFPVPPNWLALLAERFKYFPGLNNTEGGK